MSQLSKTLLMPAANYPKHHAKAYDDKRLFSMTHVPQGSPQVRSFKLTPAFVRRVVHEQAPNRETVYGDQALPRFCIRVRPPTQPGKLWPAEARIRYTVGGRRRWMTIGNVRTMDLADCATRPGRLSLSSMLAVILPRKGLLAGPPGRSHSYGKAIATALSLPAARRRHVCS
jgi:hypothetical protein